MIFLRSKRLSRRQVPTCGDDHVSGERKEQRSPDSAGNPLRVLRKPVSVAKLDRQSPHEDARRNQLAHAVEPEPIATMASIAIQPIVSHSSRNASRMSGRRSSNGLHGRTSGEGAQHAWSQCLLFFRHSPRCNHPILLLPLYLDLACTSVKLITCVISPLLDAASCRQLPQRSHRPPRRTASSLFTRLPHLQIPAECFQCRLRNVVFDSFRISFGRFSRNTDRDKQIDHDAMTELHSSCQSLAAFRQEYAAVRPSNYQAAAFQSCDGSDSGDVRYTKTPCDVGWTGLALDRQ